MHNSTSKERTILIFHDCVTMVDICYSRCLVGFTRCMLGYRRQLDSLEQLKTTWIHVLQNELMQLLLIVQAMFVQQLHTGQVLRSSNNTSTI